MKTKLVSLFALTILSLVFLVGGVSAATIFSSQDGDIIGWTIRPVGSWVDAGDYFESLDTDELSTLERTINTFGFENIVVKYDRRLGGKWESADLFNVSWSADGTIFTSVEEITGSSEDALPDDEDFISKTFNLPEEAENNSNFQIKFECTTNAQTEFCRLDNIIIEGSIYEEETPEHPSDVTDICTTTGDDLRVKKISFTNNGMSGTTFGKKDKWYPFEEIEAEIQIKNYGSNEIENIEVSWGIYDTKKGEWVIELEEEKEFDLKDGDTETLTVTFEINDNMDMDIEDLKDGKHYRFYVTVTGIDEETDEDLCAFDYAEAEIVIERDFVILTDIEFPETVSCGKNFQITGNVWNIGSKEQEDVSVFIYNKELGISQTMEIGDIDEFDDTPFSFNLQMPSEAEEKGYTLKLTVLDEDNDVYESEDDDESIFNVFFKVEGNCGSEPNAVVSASLESGGKAGQPLVIKATIVNTGDDSATFSINATGYAEWAASAELSQSTVLLNAGDSINVLMTFDVKKDVSGEKTFNIEILSENELVLSQPVSVIIEKSGFSFTGGVISGDNWYLWGIGAINFILIIVIIFVAIRVARK